MSTTADQREPDAAFWSVMGAAVAALGVLLAPFALTAPAPAVAGGPATAAVVAAVAEGYLDAWQRGDLAAMRDLVAAPPPEFEAAHISLADALDVREARFLPAAPEVSGTVATVPFSASLDLTGLGTWDYDGRLELVFAEPQPLALETSPVAEVSGGEASTTGAPPPPVVDGGAPRWAVSWSPTTLHPALLPGTALARQRSVAPRAPWWGWAVWP